MRSLGLDQLLEIISVEITVGLGGGKEDDDDNESNTKNTKHKKVESKWIKQVKNKKDNSFGDHWRKEGKKI